MSCRASSRSCTRAMPRDYYEVLGVPRDADETTIKKSFRRLARELHPDVNAHDPDAEEKFKEAAEAYEVLSDAARRQTYDAYGHDGLKSGGFSPNFEGFGSISDLFSAFFGQGGGFDARVRRDPHARRRRAGRGRRRWRSRSTLGEAARGTSVEVTYDATALCETCHGNGAEPGTPIVTCDKCRGAGQIQAVSAPASARWSAPRCATSAAATAGSPSSPATPATGAG